MIRKYIHHILFLLALNDTTAQTLTETPEHRFELQPYAGYVTNRSFSGIKRPVFISGDSLHTYSEIKDFQLSSGFQAGVQAILFANKSFNMTAGIGYQQSSNAYRYTITKGNDSSSPAVSSESKTVVDYHNTYHFFTFYAGVRRKLSHHFALDIGLTYAISAHTKQTTEGYKVVDTYAVTTSNGPLQHFNDYYTYPRTNAYLDYPISAASVQLKINYDLPVQKLPVGVYASAAYCINRVNTWLAAGLYIRIHP